MQKSALSVISIGGLDPSGGAGVLADVKTFESIGLGSCAAITSITYQNDISFSGVDWLTDEQIYKQFQKLTERFQFDFVKIGLIKNFSQLVFMVDFLKKHNPEIKIIWDPVLKASAGFDFHKEDDFSHIYDVLKMLYLVTPNLNETIIFGNILSPEEACKNASGYCNILLKGGHRHSEKATDILYINGEENALETDYIKGAAKHGSGCVLSSAITAYLSLGFPLLEACKMAKDYMQDFLQSTDHLLGKHNFQVNKSEAIL
ncbi:MAG: hydroxymethylpyrimidine/phosphomethylpyrimidine kinase [Sphingobacteriales bacterium]|nr:MAG: hydroxymethylpyrimidine/phosphomethylpyrimidine kinase [Sphingobacteriales bacterium]